MKDIGRGERKTWDAGVVVGHVNGQPTTRVRVVRGKKGWHGWPVL